MAKQVTQDELNSMYRRYKADMGGASGQGVVDQTTFAKQRGYEVVPGARPTPSQFGASDGVLVEIPGEGSSALQSKPAGKRPPEPWETQEGVDKARDKMTREGTRRTYPPDNAENVTEPGGFKARRTQNDDGSYTLTMGKPNEADYGTMTYSRQRAPGSNFEYAGRREAMRGGNYGYDPQEARQAQAGPEWMRQAGPNTWTGSGFTFQGNAGDARRFLAEAARQKLHGADAPVSGNDTFLKYRQMELARQNQPQPQMPEAPEGGWQTKLRAYQTQMDAYNQALNRQQAMEIARMGDARQGGQLGLQQDQLRQQLMLGLMGHDLQADQNAVNRAKMLAEMQAAALGMQSQQAQLGLQQGVMDAFANGTPQEQESMTRLYQALYGKGKTSDKATRSPWRYVPGKGDDEGAAAGMLVNQETGETRVVDGMTPAQQYYYGTLYQTLSKEMRDSIEGMPALARNAVIERMYREALANQEKDKKKK